MNYIKHIGLALSLAVVVAATNYKCGGDGSEAGGSADSNNISDVQLHEDTGSKDSGRDATLEDVVSQDVPVVPDSGNDGGFDVNYEDIQVFVDASEDVPIVDDTGYDGGSDVNGDGSVDSNYEDIPVFVDASEDVPVVTDGGQDGSFDANGDNGTDAGTPKCDNNPYPVPAGYILAIPKDDFLKYFNMVIYFGKVSNLESEILSDTILLNAEYDPVGHPITKYKVVGSNVIFSIAEGYCEMALDTASLDTAFQEYATPK